MDPVLSEVVSVLGRTSSTLRTLLEDLPEPWLGRFEGEGTFDPREIVGHLIHAERTDWVPRVQRILDSGETRPFDPFDRRGYRGASEMPMRELLAQFEAERERSLAFLTRLSPSSAQLASRGRHPELGPVTLGQLLATWVVHDLNHLAQVARTLSRRYEEAVGPWKPYLGILKR